MMRRITLLLLLPKILVLVVLFWGCKQRINKEYIQIEGFTQGTTFNIAYYDVQKRNFSVDIDSILAAIDTSMSIYNPASVIVAFNSSTNGAEVDNLLAEVVLKSIAISNETNGAFDITVGPLVKAWGFHIKRGEMPTKSDIEELLNLIGLDKIALNGNYLQKKHPKVMIDVNAIAQGYTVDLIGEFLERKGVTDYLVEVGGEVRTLGLSPRGSFWVVGVDKPMDDAISGEDLQVKIALSGQSLVTSGNYRKFFVRNGVKYSHTIDTKTGYPANHTLLSATVLDKTGARADALATAFMVMGLDSTKRWLQRNPEVETYLIYSDSIGTFQTWMTPGIKEMIVE
jgi:thiamine biosynthesis lipoprotein